MADLATSNATLASQINDLLAKWNNREAEFKAWLAGTAAGGPNGDGRYPLTDPAGVTNLVDCPAKLSDTVNGPAGLSSAAKLGSEGARDAALTYRDRAITAETNAAASQSAALAARDTALLYRDQAAASASNAQTARSGSETAQTAAKTSETNAATSEANAKTSETNAKASEVAAANSAAQAATINPADYIPVTQKAAADGVATLNTAGQVPFSQIPATAIVDVYEVPTEEEQVALVSQEGDVCVRSDINKSFIRNGNAYVGTMADWTELRSPTDAVLSVHGRVGAVDLSDLFQAKGSYAPAVHTHLWADITDKPADFPPSTHAHTFADLTSKPTTLAGYGITDAAEAVHTHSYLPLTGGTLTGKVTLPTGAWSVGSSDGKNRIYFGNLSHTVCHSAFNHIFRTGDNATVDRFVMSDSGLNVVGTYSASGTQVVTSRRTGWAAPTGTATRTTFDTATVTSAQLAERLKALIDDLTTHGLIGA